MISVLAFDTLMWFISCLDSVCLLTTFFKDFPMSCVLSPFIFETSLSSVPLASMCSVHKAC